MLENRKPTEHFKSKSSRFVIESKLGNVRNKRDYKRSHKATMK